LRIDGSPASAYRPSASTTVGTRSAAISARTIATVSGRRPRPGPITAASNRSAARRISSPASPPSAPSRVSGSGSVIASVNFAASTGFDERAAATVTSPAPERKAAEAARQAAPVIPGDPATTSTCPKSPLCARRERGGKRDCRSASTTRSPAPSTASTRSGGSPMSATRILPQCAGPSPETIPVFGRPIATVAAARTAIPRTAPVVASRPDGTSMASTGERSSRMNPIAAAACPETSPAAPVPRIPSTARPYDAASSRKAASSAGVSTDVVSPPSASYRRRFSIASRAMSPRCAKRSIRTAIPSARRRRAATNASPPLFPFPAHRRTRGRSRPSRIIAAAQRATTAPARSIRSRPGIPRPTMAARSSSRICAAVTSFIWPCSRRGGAESFRLTGPVRFV